MSFSNHMVCVKRLVVEVVEVLQATCLRAEHRIIKEPELHLYRKLWKIAQDWFVTVD
jgi:hypothetical protein